jgi:hypothetical protein
MDALAVAHAFQHGNDGQYCIAQHGQSGALLQMDPAQGERGGGRIREGKGPEAWSEFELEVKETVINR